MSLTDKQKQRYARNLVLPDFGEIGQEKLLNAKVLVIGAGGLGSPAIFYLASAGIGTIGIIDGDVVEISNLQRQILHFTDDINNIKVESAKEKIKKLNPDINIKTYNEIFNKTNADKILKDYDFVLDCTDNIESKFFINDACVANNKPFSHAGISEFEGQLITIIPGETACYRCIFHSEPKGFIKKLGVPGFVPGVVGTIQATEAVKFILGIGTLLTNTILKYNSLTMDFRKIQVKRNVECCSCGSK
jgi:molybdopterin-synthase adenylyltransferase